MMSSYSTHSTSFVNNSDEVKTVFLVSNCQKKKSATLLLNRISNITENIIAITEPWLGKLNKCTFQSPWKVMTKEDNSRAALISPPWADPFMHSEQSDRDSVFCTLKIGMEKIIVGVMYVENGAVDVIKWSNRLNYLQKICPKIIVFADSNAHSTLWGYKKSDYKGKKWEELLGLTNLEVFTNSYADTFKNSRNFTSCIDIAFGSPILKPELSDRLMNFFPSASDHLTWGLDFRVPRENSEGTFWKLKSADWDKVNASLFDKIQNLPRHDLHNELSIESEVESLTTIFKTVMDENIGKQLVKPKHRWWNRDLTDLEKSIEREHDGDIRKELIKELEVKCLEAQAENWKQFASNCNSVSGAFLKMKLTNLDKGQLNLQSITKDNGVKTQSAQETANYLLSKWFQLDRDTLNDQLLSVEQEIHSKYPVSGVGNFPPVTFTDVENAVLGMKPFSASGIDGIPIIAIQKTINVIGLKLVDIFNSCLKQGFTPVAWKTGKTVLIPKPGPKKGNHKDYRPITLLPGFVKIFEKIILKRLQKSAEIDKWISNKQFAFQAGRSVNQALLQYGTKVSSGIKSKRPTAALHLDIEGAFNSVWLPVLVKRLESLGCPAYLINWCYNYLLDREQIYESSGFTTGVNVQRSTPQGGSLSPFFWNLIVDPLIERLRGMSDEVCAFADDIAVIVSDDSWEAVSRRLNRILVMTSDWAQNNALKFNADKSNFIQYSWKRRVQTLNLFMNGVKLKRETKVKYLGVIFTEKLQWKAHVTYITNKAIKCLFSLRGIVNRTWGLSGKYLRILYLGAIEPIITHGCIIWCNALSNKTIMKPIKRVQRLASLMITRANCKSHYLDLLMLAGIHPIELRIKELAMRCWTGICSDAEEPCRDALHQLGLHKNVRSHPSAIQQLDIWNNQLGIDINDIELEYSAQRTKLKDKTPGGLIALNQDECVLIGIDDADIKYYTDGSKSDEGVGAAYTKWENDNLICSWGIPLYHSCSSYKAEIVAIKNALDDAMNDCNDNIAIITDSQAVLSALKSPSRDKTTEDIRMKLKRINRYKSVKLGWTKAHVGNKGNESADCLAKAIAKIRPTNCEGKLDRMEIKHVIKQQIMMEWQYLWDSRNTKWSYRWNGTVSKKMRFEMFNNYESELLSNFVCGSIALNEKKHLWGKRNNPYCVNDYGLSETPKHFLFDCSNNVGMRNDIMNTICLETGIRQISCREIWKSEMALRLLAEKLIDRMSKPD